MSQDTFKPFQMEEIVKKTIDSIEEGKKQIFEIAEEARQERSEVEQKLEELKKKVKATIDEVELLEVLEKESRRKLMKVSKDFKYYSEQDIKEAYENTRNLQIKLALKREQEQQLISQRTDLEMQIRKINNTLKKAEYLVGHVAIAINYLTVTLMNISSTLEELQKKEELGVRVIMAQEEERQRVAMDIHDGPAQSMSNIVLKCEICEKLLDVDLDKAREEIRELKQLVRSSLKEIRKIIFDLRPMSLDDLGLIPTLQRYVSDFINETGINVVLDLYSTEYKVESVIEVAVFRIIQEALNNIKKYADATEVFIRLKIKNDIMMGAVIDNGVGFDVDKVLQTRDGNTKTGGFGIYGMRQRAELLKGKFALKSQPGKGTTLRLEIPLNSKERESTYEENKSYGS